MTETTTTPYKDRWKLCFHGALETDYRHDYNRRYQLQISVAMFLCLILFMCAGALDYLLLQEKVYPVWRIRYGFFGPLFLVLGASALNPPFYRHFQQELLLLLLLLCTGLGMLAMMNITTSTVQQTYFTGLLLTLMAASTTTHLHLRLVLLASLILIIMPVMWRLLWAPVDWQAFGVELFLLFTVAGLGLVASFHSERAARRRFLTQRFLQLQRQDLVANNTQLKHLVARDPLTGIANRRLFDISIQEEWKRAARSQYPISLFMVDIDYFKKYNDHYGHPKGDTCLSAVALSLASLAKRPGDRVARYGGEEFALIFPHMDAKKAKEQGQKICDIVAGQALPHTKSDIAKVVTVSVGAATQTPRARQQWQPFLQQADQQLYVAKHQGRNRCSHVNGQHNIRTEENGIVPDQN